MTTKITIANHDDSKHDIVLHVRNDTGSVMHSIAPGSVMHSIAPGTQIDVALYNAMDIRAYEGDEHVIIETDATNVESISEVIASVEAVEVNVLQAQDTIEISGEAVVALSDPNGIPGLSDAPDESPE